MAARKPLIAGNWKMFGRAADLGQIAALDAATAPAAGKVDVILCPPAVYVQSAAGQAHGTSILIGAQDCSPLTTDAARTGEVSAAMLADAGARFVIVGHSERRQIWDEGDDIVRNKAQAVLGAGITPIICVGETLPEREKGQASQVVGNQIWEAVPPESAGTLGVVAYEPVWAIGTNKIPTAAQIAEIHQVIRETLEKRFGSGADGIRILYGGSVGPANAGEIFAVEGVDGALVGRASLRATDFSAIILAHPAVS